MCHLATTLRLAKSMTEIEPSSRCSRSTMAIASDAGCFALVRHSFELREEANFTAVIKSVNTGRLINQMEDANTESAVNRAGSVRVLYNQIEDE
jgi:hypothetical protein